MRIEVIGGIASGKSTLLSAIALRGLAAVFEDFTANPFFDHFYRDPVRYAFETEITFMLQHFSALKDAIREGTKIVASDYSLALDLAYARVTLGSADLNVFEAVLDSALARIGCPDLLIKLDCPPDVEMMRIRARARPAEQTIPLAYLAELNDATNEILSDPRFHGLSVLRIDSANLDFRPEGKDKDQVITDVLKSFPGALGISKFLDGAAKQ